MNELKENVGYSVDIFLKNPPTKLTGIIKEVDNERVAIEFERPKKKNPKEIEIVRKLIEIENIGDITSYHTIRDNGGSGK